MALPKLFQRIFWHNNATPAINEDNLNAMSKGLSDVDDRLIGLAGTIMEDVPQIQEDIEELEELAEDLDTAVQTAQNAATSAQSSASNANAKALVSEGWAKGTQNGTAVGSSSPYYHNNAEYFKNQARSFTPEGYQDLVDDVDSLKGAYTENVNRNGCKNRLKNVRFIGNHFISDTMNVDVDEDGIVTTHGTRSSTLYFPINVQDGGDAIPYPFTDVDMRLSGCPSGGGDDSYRLSLSFYSSPTGTATVTYRDTGNGVIIPATSNVYYKVNVTVPNGSPNSLVYKPMLTSASELDSDYAHFEPFAKTNRQLSIDSLTCEDFSKVGAVNIAKITAVTQTVNGVTFTINPDTGKVTASNNAASANIRLVLATMTLKAGVTYKLSDTKDGKATCIRDNTLAIRLPGSTWLAATDGYYNNLYTPSADTEVQLIRAVKSGLTPYSECYPMITVMSDYSGPYVPRAMTNKELTDELEVKRDTTTISNVYCYRQGKVVTINIQGSFSITAGQNNNIGTLPSEFRPNDTNVRILLFTNDAPPKLTNCTIYTDGTVQINGWQASGTLSLYGQITYIRK